MNFRQQQYWDLLSDQVPRLLCQLDRNPLSTTFGSFDRKYWHQRFTDFSSASLQQGVEALAHLYQSHLFESRYYKSGEVLGWIEAAVDFTHSIQNWDGSFDEWYLAERGWAGPTAYILNALYEAYSRTGQDWQEETKTNYFEILNRGSQSLVRFEEAHVLSNHQALAMLAVYQAFHVTGDVKHKIAYEKIKQRFLKTFNQQEGWSLEYDGADPGYQTATLSFLARLHRLNQDKTIVEWAQQQLRFVTSFFYPDGSFARGIGSRATEVTFYFGIEYWAQFIAEAQPLALRMLESLQQRKILSPTDHEDHYFIYRLPELLLAAEVAQEFGPHQDFIWPGPHLSKEYIVGSNQNFGWVIHPKFGGRYWIFDLKNRKCLGGSNDIFFRNERGQISTSGCASGRVTQSDFDSLTVVSHFSRYKTKRFRPVSFWLFKTLFPFFNFHPLLARLSKTWIRKVLMFQAGSSRYQLQRKFAFSESKIQVETTILGPKYNILVIDDPLLASRFVPQSLYCVSDERLSAEKRSRSWECIYSCAQ